MKIAFVVQRCGQNIFAGAEVLVLQLGIKLSEIFDIDILTTTAKDASNWKNFYPEGTEKIGKLTIRRFMVDKERDPSYVPLSTYLEAHNDDEQRGLDFINANGPISTKLIDFIKRNKDQYDLFIFFGYIYWQTFHGLPIVKEKSLLFTQAHDEPWIYFNIYNQVFQNPIGYLFQTIAEKKFVLKKFGQHHKPFAIVGHGINQSIAQRTYKSKIKIPKRYILYIGRISAGKGCQRLSDFYNRYQEINKTDVELVMVGTLEHPISNTNSIIFEKLSDDDKFFVLQNCEIFIMPSAYESLNLACLEAWMFKKPAIVNEDSAVLAEHCRLGQCGLYFKNYEEFSECLDLILKDKELASKLGENGEKYVKEQYNWDVTIKKYKEFFDEIKNQINVH